MSNIENWTHSDKSLFLDYLKYNSYCSKKHRILYVSTPKVACTSLKWWFAEIEDYKKALLDNQNYSLEVDQYLTIHDTFHKVAPLVTGLDYDSLIEPITSDSYIRFAIVRNPFKRIFSAWQSKILLREPNQINPYINSKHYNIPIENSFCIAKSFEAFLEEVLQIKNSRNMFDNVHWAPQVSLLRPDLITYTNISQIEDVKKITNILSERMGTNFINPFDEKRRFMNESLIPYHPDLITKKSIILIRNLYAEDFDFFGYSNLLPDVKNNFSQDHYEVALKAISTIRSKHNRMGNIINFNQTLLSNKDENTINLNQKLLDRDEEIKSLNQKLLDRDEEINRLNCKLNLILESKTWRLVRLLSKSLSFLKT